MKKITITNKGRLTAKLSQLNDLPLYASRVAPKFQVLDCG